MCGICGIVCLDGPRPDRRDLLSKMMERMGHRGPDDQGTYIDEKAALGSRRLSIIDLEGGHQPIANEDETVQIVFNGEVYNYKELGLYLRKRGHIFRTQADTEVIVHLYEEFGADAVTYLDGIFALALWDKSREELLLARDRLGVKPLYYFETAEQLIFGSEMKVMLAHPVVKRDIDPVALHEYLSYEYVPSPRTIIRNVRRLEPGHVLCYGRRGLLRTQYARLSFARSETRAPTHWQDYAEELFEVLKGAVQRELVSDVPIGVLLSGGIDSSTITALMAQVHPRPVESFSIGFEESSFDESRHARAVANHFGTRHHELIVTAGMAAESVPLLTRFLDEPFGDSSWIPSFLLCRFAREHVKVVLGGDGGDELFGGYPTLAAHRLIEYYERIVPWAVRTYLSRRIPAWLPVSFDNISLDFKLRRFLSGRGVPLLARHHRWMGSFTDEEKRSLLEGWLMPVVADTYALAYAHGRECDARLSLNQVLYDDMKLYLEGDILFKVDRASMANSLEVRVPFLNRAVVDFATSLPLDLKLRRLTGKYILKKAMHGLLPNEIVKRRKKGFNMPVAHWLTSELRELTLDMLCEGRVRRQGFFDWSYVKRLLDDHFARRCDNRKLLWTLLIFQLWYEAYGE